MRFKEFISLDEMPMTIGKIGDFSKKSFNWDDRDLKMLNNPKALRKIEKAYSKKLGNFNVFFVDLPNIKNSDLPHETSEEEIRSLGIQAPIHDHMINIFYTNNQNDPLTPWILAHRFGHILRGQIGFDPGYFLEQKFLVPYFKVLEKTGIGRNYGYLSPVLNSLLTMKSARSGKLTFDNREWVHELIAQFIMQGRVKFNPLPSIEKVLGFLFQNKSDLDRIASEVDGEINFLQSEWKEFEESINQKLSEAMNKAKGRVYIW